MSCTVRESELHQSVHELIFYGHRTLRREAEPVREIVPELHDLVKSMFGIMKDNNGIGLAAPQINIAQMIVTIDLESYELGKFEILNPRIVHLSEMKEPYDEGCLSIPGIFESVVRPVQITIEALNLDGKEIELTADGILARVLQHEIDHLHGILFVDHLDEQVRHEYKKEFKRIRKLNKINS